VSQILTLAGIGGGESHIGPARLGLHPTPQATMSREGKGLMNAYSLVTKLFRATDDGSAAFQLRQPILLPRTAADDLPPYRGQPWIIDRRGYRNIDPSMTLVPASRL